jgi:hypothetical protein
MEGIFQMKTDLNFEQQEINRSVGTRFEQEIK